MFLKKLSLKRVSMTLGLLLLLAGAYVYSYQNNKLPQTKKNLSVSEKVAATKKLNEILKQYYPDAAETMSEVYELIGLSPLLEQYLAVTKPDESLSIVNRLLQRVLLRENFVQRHDLEDNAYLGLVYKRLKQAYKIAQLSPEDVPVIDADKAARLRVLLSAPALWDVVIPSDKPSINTALLMGSSYIDYKNRQDNFFELMDTRKIALSLDETGKFPVYLLGGARPLVKEMDAAIIKKLPVKANEQDMMNYLFDEAIRLRTPALGPIERIATNSPKESQGRPTTAGTLNSFIGLSKHLFKNQNAKETVTILVISSAPFIEYQRLVTERVFLQAGLKNVSIVAAGPGIEKQIQLHPELSQKAFIAIVLDNEARRFYEADLVHTLKQKLKITQIQRDKSKDTAAKQAALLSSFINYKEKDIARDTSLVSIVKETKTKLKVELCKL